VGLTRLGVAKVFVASGFFFVCSLLTEPSNDTFRPTVRMAMPKIEPSPVAARSPVIAPVAEEAPRDRLPSRLAMLPIHWESFPPSQLRTIDFVRRETGDDLSPLDFEDSQSPNPFFSWVGEDSLSLPSWLHASVKSFTTPSGSDVDVNLYFHWDDWKVLLAFRNQTTMNGPIPTGYYPGVTLELYEYPISLSRQPVLVSPRMSLWSQPTDRSLGFQNESIGVLGSLTVEVPLSDNLWLWLEGRGKSEGWVGDNQVIESALDMKTGLHWSL